MEPSEGFSEFVACVDAGSISGGADALGLPRATVSRRLSRLEARLAVRLIHRDTHRFDVTEAGRTLYGRARHVVAEAREAIEAIARHDPTPRGRLRISLPPTLPDTPFTELITGFVQSFPEVEVEAHTGTAHVDLRAERVDVALRAGPVRDPDVVARRLLSNHQVVVASPAWLAAHGPVDDLQALATHRVLAGFDAGRVPQRHWPRTDGGRVEIRTRFCSNDVFLVRDAAVHGLGMALLPSLLLRRPLAEGTLVPVLAGVIGRETHLSVVYPERAFVLPKVRAFVDHTLAWFEDHADLFDGWP